MRLSAPKGNSDYILESLRKEKDFYDIEWLLEIRKMDGLPDYIHNAISIRINEITGEEREFYLQLLQKILPHQIDPSIAIGDFSDSLHSYQVMTCDDFFDWYCFKYPDGQFFPTAKEAFENYMSYRFQWLEKGKPKPF